MASVRGSSGGFLGEYTGGHSRPGSWGEGGELGASKYNQIFGYPDFSDFSTSPQSDPL
jgi:hypothetical protein